jgi:hypothetical protein
LEIDTLLTNPETSAKLSNLGVEQESFWYWYRDPDKKEFQLVTYPSVNQDDLQENVVSAYTLHELLDKMSRVYIRRNPQKKKSKDFSVASDLVISRSRYINKWVVMHSDFRIRCIHSNPVEALGDCITKVLSK